MLLGIFFPMATSLWQLDTCTRVLRCELCEYSEGSYQLRIVRNQAWVPFLEKEFSARRAALEFAIRLYRGFKDSALRDADAAHSA